VAPQGTKPRERALDFIVIGVQKGGTTSLWQYLRCHPQIAMPKHKEAPAFCAPSEQVPVRLAWVMEACFGDAPPEAVLGKAATCYMMGDGANDVDVEQVAERIARALPDVRLIALLRDPIERAMSHYRMSVRRGLESRSFDTAIEELLEPERLELGRAGASETNSYLVQGEYGRILRIYRARFPSERIHVESTADLGRDPGPVIDRILAFLGLPAGFRPPGLGVRHHRGGGRARLDRDGEARLRAYLEENVWPRVVGGKPERVKAMFEFNSFMGMWNVIPDDRQPPISAANRERLEEHYRADGRLLEEYGVNAPWLDSWAVRA